MKTEKFGVLAGAALLLLISVSSLPAAQAAAANYQPIALTGLTQDLVANGEATTLASTTTNFDVGERVFYQQGYRTLQYGLPAAGVVTSVNPDLSGAVYQLASYSASNALLLRTGSPSGTLTLGSPATYSALAVLATSADGASAVTVTLNFGDSSSTVVALTIPDWYNGANPAISGLGRVLRDGSATSAELGTATNPRLYDFPIVLSSVDRAKQLVSVSFTMAASNSSAAIFAVSGIRSQSITFGTAPTVVVGGTGTVTATASSGLAVTLTSTTPTVCTIAGTTVTGVAAGTCTIAGNQAGDATYAPATQVTQQFDVGKSNQSPFTATATPSSIPAGTTSVISTSGGSGNGAVSFALTSGEASCTLAGNTVTGTAIGSCVVTATKAGGASYNDAVARATVTVTKGSQTITFGAAPSLVAGGSATLAATASSGLPVTFATQTSQVCTVSGSKVTGVAAGMCTVSANQAGNASYSAAPQVTQTFQVGAGMAITGAGSGGGTMGSSCADPQAYCFGISGTGSAAGIQNGNIAGQVTYWPNTSQVQGAVTVTPPSTTKAAPAAGTFSLPRFTPAPGDKAYVNVSGTAVKGVGIAGSVQAATTPGPIQPGDTVILTGGYVITGGEGQLAGATGSGSLFGTGVVGQTGDVWVDRMVMEGGIMAPAIAPNLQQIPVPTLGGWALIVLTAMLAAIGLRRRWRTQA